MFTSIESKIKEHIKHSLSLKPFQYISRLLCSFFLVVLLTYLSSENSFTDHAFYSGIIFPLFIYFVLVLFAVLCFTNNDTLINVVLITAMTLYFSLVALEKGDYLFSSGLCLILCAVIYFFVFDKYSFTVGHKTVWTVAILLLIFSTLFVGGICCLYYKNYRTPCYDFGLFAQMFYHMKETGNCLITCERDGLLSHFAVHFSPVYYLLLPIYVLIPSPCTLLIAQAFIVASGVIPLILICKHYKLSELSAILFTICYIFYPSFMGGCFWYLHENCFLAPLILWYMYFSEKGSAIPTVIFALLTLSVKEDAPVYVAVIALYFIFNHKNYKCNLFLLAFSVIYFIVVTKLMSVYGEGIMSDSRYGDYIYDGDGLFTVIKSVIQNPAFALLQVFRQEKLLFVLQMLTPLCFLPFVIKKPSKLILLIPFILVNLMTNYRYQYDIGFQYTFGSGSILMYLAVTNYANLGKNRGKILLCAALCSVVIFSGGYFEKSGYVNTYKSSATERETINEAMTLIPDDASVACSTFLLANLSQRKEIYELETTNQKAQYIVVDLRFADNSISEYLNERYAVVFIEDGVIAIFKALE